MLLGKPQLQPQTISVSSHPIHLATSTSPSFASASAPRPRRPPLPLRLPGPSRRCHASSLRSPTRDPSPPPTNAHNRARLPRRRLRLRIRHAGRRSVPRRRANRPQPPVSFGLASPGLPSSASLVVSPHAHPRACLACARRAALRPPPSHAVALADSPSAATAIERLRRWRLHRGQPLYIHPSIPRQSGTVPRALCLSRCPVTEAPKYGSGSSASPITESRARTR